MRQESGGQEKIRKLIFLLLSASVEKRVSETFVHSVCAHHSSTTLHVDEYDCHYMAPVKLPLPWIHCFCYYSKVAV